jgi:hypothetical protein
MARRTEVKVTLAPGFPARVMVIAAPKLAIAAEIVAAEQRRLIPVSADGSNGRPAGYARDRIAVRPGADGGGPYYDVGSDATTPDGVSYPTILDAGSRPHTITAHGDYPLRDRHGHIFGHSVNHPGTKPTYWCRRSILALAGRVL